MTDPLYPAPPRLTLDDLDPESATTDRLIAMVRATARASTTPRPSNCSPTCPWCWRALCDHLLSGEATALDVAYRLASLIDIVFTQMTKAGVFPAGLVGRVHSNFTKATKQPSLIQPPSGAGWPGAIGHF